MTDLRWQRAMERLGLWLGPEHASMGTSGRCVLQPDPDDPATFKLVVEAARLKGCWLDMWTAVYPNKKPAEGYHCKVRGVENKIHVGFTLESAVYEAVMEAFGNA